MTWLNLTGVTCVTALMVWAEWRGLEFDCKRERAALIAIAAAGWLVAVLVLVFPNMPGPIELFNNILKPLASGLK
ncbi:hypothetical protein GCM10023310_49090 [Paenibacillus vulneris]|uniref:Uncharacterized protein n=1 Tax=Paenibacillus vulneris TaxID=1133364 RepID=A0ABW3UHF2_9BACL